MTTLAQEHEIEVVDLWELGLEFAIENVRPDVGIIKAWHVSWDVDEAKIKTPIELEDCAIVAEQGNHTHQRKRIFEQAELLQGRKKTSFLCPINVESMPISGNFATQLFEYVKISLQGCQLETGCLSDEEISEKTLDLTYLAAYPNILGKNKDEVVRYRTDTNNFVYLDPGHTQTINIFFMESTLTLKDQIWDIFEFTEYDINIAEHSHSTRAHKWMSPNLPKSEREYVTLYLRQDEQKRLYKREEYDILTYLGDMGGLLDIILLFGVFLSSPFVNRLFHAALVKKTYRI